MNTLASWADPSICEQHLTPYVSFVHVTKGPVLAGAQKMWTQFHDVFDPEFRSAITHSIESCQYAIGDPWCIGFYVDNELYWGKEVDFVLWTLSSPTEQAAKQEFVRDLQAKYEAVEKLNTAWGSEYESWDQLASATEKPDAKKADTDLRSFSKKFSETYFRTVDEELERAAPKQLWYATSIDGITWKEEGLAVARGESGAYDDRSVFTSEIMKHDGTYYLVYQTVKSPYTVRVKEEVGLAWAKSPDGPWTKSDGPILSPADNGVWKANTKSRFAVLQKGDFDSLKTHDPCILPFKGKFYLYYKGEQMGEAITFGGRQIRHGVAIADNPQGPYVKSPYNPISNSGHEVCVWPYNGGIASLITTDGPEKNTIQWAPDGINFEIMSVIKDAPHAIGLNRAADNEKEPTEILRWGLTHQYTSWDYQQIRRFTSHRIINHVAPGEEVD